MAPPFPMDVEPPPSVLVFDSGPMSSNPMGAMQPVAHHPNAIITTPREGNQDQNQTLRPSEVAELSRAEAHRGAFPQIREHPGAKSNAAGPVDLEQQMNPLDVTASRHGDDLRG